MITPFASHAITLPWQGGGDAADISNSRRRREQHVDGQQYMHGQLFDFLNYIKLYQIISNYIKLYQIFINYLINLIKYLINLYDNSFI